jgi:hypothetical protein
VHIFSEFFHSQCHILWVRFQRKLICHKVQMSTNRNPLTQLIQIGKYVQISTTIPPCHGYVYSNQLPHGNCYWPEVTQKSKINLCRPHRQCNLRLDHRFRLLSWHAMKVHLLLHIFRFVLSCVWKGLSLRLKGPIQCRNIHLHNKSACYCDVLHTFPSLSPRASPRYFSKSVLIKPHQDHHVDLPVHTGLVPFIVL